MGAKTPGKAGPIENIRLKKVYEELTSLRAEVQMLRSLVHAMIAQSEKQGNDHDRDKHYIYTTDNSSKPAIKITNSTGTKL